MGTSVNSSERPADSGVTISFGERFAASDQFDAIFREGMALVEHAATYLDGSGRKEARQLRGPPAMLYAAPRIAFIPLLIVWVGAGIQTQIVMVVLNAVFPIVVSTMAGVAT